MSGAAGSSIGDYDRAAVVGGPYSSEAQARTAAEKSKRALLYWAIDHRVGIDFGDGRQLSRFTKEGLAWQEERLGCPVRTDIHGIDVYEHVEGLKFVGLTVKGTLSKHAPRLVEVFQREYQHNRRLTARQVLASEIYSSSFFDVSPRSRFITLVTAVEALSEQRKRSDEVAALVKEFKSTTQNSMIDQSVRESMLGSLERLKSESIGQAGRALVKGLIPGEHFDNQPATEFFTYCYGLRSEILHSGSIADQEVDMRHLANVMESFVARLLLVSLSTAP